MHEKERLKVRDEGQVDSCMGKSVGLTKVQTQAIEDEVACFSGEVRVWEGGVDSDLHIVGMTGNTWVVVEKNGRGKVLVEERHSLPDDGNRLSGKMSGPKVY